MCFSERSVNTDLPIRSGSYSTLLKNLGFCCHLDPLGLPIMIIIILILILILIIILIIPIMFKSAL